MENNFDKVKKYYNEKLWDIDQVKKAINKWITLEQFIELVGESTSIEEIKEMKLYIISSNANQKIEEGQDIKLSDNSTDHFTYKSHDQSNIKNAFDIANALIAKGTDMEIPFYDSNNVCKKYKSADIITIYMSMQSYITYITTLCHQLQKKIKETNDIEFVKNVELDVKYLDGEYLQTFNDMIAQSSNIVSALST